MLYLIVVEFTIDRLVVTMEENIERTRQEFEQSFKEATFYNRQTNDEKHLGMLVKLCSPASGETILDLGTGSGYVAFELSKQYPNCNVIGLDIVSETISRNTVMARKYAYTNLSFNSYNGTILPFPDKSMDKIISRYALHHFLNPYISLQEAHRILKAKGRIIISDPTPNQNDTMGFVDEYMKIKPDGHVKFYSFAELDKMLCDMGFRLIKKEMTSIRFPRKRPSDYVHLLGQDNRHIWMGYNICIEQDEIWITENVLNLVYEKI